MRTLSQDVLCQTLYDRIHYNRVHRQYRSNLNSHVKETKRSLSGEGEVGVGDVTVEYRPGTVTGQTTIRTRGGRE